MKEDKSGNLEKVLTVILLALQIVSALLGIVKILSD